ncbi:hypothetical protein BDR26DRAFT_874082 [Obelidium mucronatum]|nr:hypothetical protein BDR26DRAFT_874082 [Obelidium mucronatum]
MDPLFATVQALDIRNPASKLPGYKPLYVANYYVSFPIFALGVLLNGLLALGILAHPKLLTTRISQIMFFTILVSFSWSLGSVMYVLLFLAPGLQGRLDVLRSAFALFTSLFMVLQTPLAIANRCYMMISSLFLLVVGVIFWLFLSSPSLDGIEPKDELQSMFWGCFMGLLFLGCTIVMTSLYIRTYQVSTSLLRDSIQEMSTILVLRKLSQDSQVPLVDPHALERLDKLRVKAEWKIAVNSIVMSFCMMSLYVPYVLYEVIVRIVLNTGGDFRGLNLVALNCVGRVAISVDTVLTPLLFLYFRPDFRHTLVFWRTQNREIM